jgi:hypothetical protein
MAHATLEFPIVEGLGTLAAPAEAAKLSAPANDHARLMTKWQNEHARAVTVRAALRPNPR